MTEPTPEQVAALDWFEDPEQPTPTAEEAARRFRNAGIVSTEHARKIKEKKDKKDKEVKKVADPKAGGKPSKGTPADKRIKENKKGK